MPDLDLGHIAFTETEKRYVPPERRRKKRRSQLSVPPPDSPNPAIAPKFELVTGQTPRPLQERSSLPTTIVSLVAHTGVFGVAFLLFSVSAGIALPTPRQASNLIAVVVAAPPPPPPLAPAPAAASAPAAAEPAAVSPLPPAPPLERPLQTLAALPGLARLAPEERPASYGLGGLGSGPSLSNGFGGVAGGVGWGAGTAPGPQEPVKVAAAEAPTLIHRVEPVYPKEASAGRIQGTVVVEATVDEQGNVQDVKILRSIEQLDDAAIAAVRQWRYEPLTVDGKPASFVITINVSFHLR